MGRQNEPLGPAREKSIVRTPRDRRARVVHRGEKKKWRGGARRRRVRTLRDGRVQLVHRGKKLKWRELPGRPVRAPRPARPAKAVAVASPAAHHPWRRFGGAVGREYWRGIKRRRSGVLGAPIRGGGGE